MSGSSGIYGSFDSEGPIEQVGAYFVGIRVSTGVDWIVQIYDFY